MVVVGDGLYVAPVESTDVLVFVAYHLNTGLVTPLAVADKLAVSPLQILVPAAVIVVAIALEFTVTVTALRSLVAFSQ